jgi:WD40 repeat protein
MSDDGRYVASSIDSTVVLYEPLGGKWEQTRAAGRAPRELGRLTQEEHVRNIELSQSGEYIAVASGNMLRVYTTGTRQEVKRVPHADAAGNPSEVNFIQFTPDGGHVVTATEGVAALLRIATPDRRNVRAAAGPNLNTTGVSNAGFSGDGRIVAFSTQKTDIALAETGSGNTVKTLAPKELGGVLVDRLVVSGDGQHVAAYLRGRPELVIFDNATGVIDKLDTKSTVIERCVGISGDGRYIAVQNGQELQVYNVRMLRQPRWTLKSRTRPYSIAFSGDNGRLAVAGGGGATIFELATGKQTPIAHSALVRTVVFSPDGRHLALGGFAGDIAVFDTAKPERLWSQVAQEAASEAGQHIFSLSFSPDSNFLLAAALRAPARMFEALTGKEVFESPDRNLLAAGFADNGREILTLTTTALRRYRWRSDDLVQDLCSRLWRDLSPKEKKTYLGQESYSNACPAPVKAQTVPTP